MTRMTTHFRASLLAVVAAISASCAESGDPASLSSGDVAMTMTAPLADRAVSRGGSLECGFRVENLLLEPTHVVGVDADGVLDTVADQYPLLFSASRGIPTRPAGTVNSTRTIPMFEVPVGTYTVFGRADDERTRPVAAMAPGRVTIENRAWADRAGGFADEAATAVAVADDETTYVAGNCGTVLELGGVQLANPSGGLFVAALDQGGAVRWGRNEGGTGAESVDDAVALTDGVALIGSFENDVTLGTGQAAETRLTGVGRTGWVAQYAEDGELVWAQTLPGRVRKVAAAGDGAVFVTGLFAGTTTIGAGRGGEVSLTAPGSVALFVACFEPNGDVRWARAVDGAIDVGGLAVRADGACFVAGSLQSAATFGAGTGSVTLTSRTGDAFLARYAIDGALEGAWRLSNDSTIAVDDLAIWREGVVLAGGFEGPAMFPEADGRMQILPAFGQRELLFGRFGANGMLERVVGSVGSAGSSVEGASVAVSPTAVYVAGTFRGSFEFAGQQLAAANDADPFLVRLVDGFGLWSTRGNGFGDDGIVALAAYSDDSTIMIGSLRDSLELGAGEPNGATLTSGGGDDALLWRVNADGDM